MYKKRKKILMATANYWTSPFQVGSHHLARGFSDLGWDVAFVSDPISPFHCFGGITDGLIERFELCRTTGKHEGNIWAYVPGALITPHNKPILRSEFVYKNWQNLTLPNVKRLLQQKGFGEVDLLYFDSVHQSFWLNAIKYSKSIFRIADNNVGFKKSTELTKKLECELAQSVSAVIYTAENLKNYVEKLRPKRMIHVPNGVNYRHFFEGSSVLPKEYKEISGPIAVYVGALDFWFDYELINQIAKELPYISFVLIGPDNIARQRIEKLPNIYLLGRRSYVDLPAYLHNADVGIIPFDVKKYPELVHSINPLKLYEYMACGLPVVSTEWQELKNLNSPAILCQTKESFIQGIISSVSSDHQKEPFFEYAAKEDWSYRVKRLIQELRV